MTHQGTPHVWTGNPHRLEAQFRGTIGTFALDAQFVAPPTGVTALFGPSGSGKSTILRCMAGLEQVADGHFSFGSDAVWQDGGVFVPPHRREVGYVFQDANLFPHFSVRKNLCFGQQRAQQHCLAFDDVVHFLKLAPLLDRMPARLSGGEKQRVAIGRALLSQPRLLLMDEPLSALDMHSRMAILPYLEQLQDILPIPVIYVSHDIREVEWLADYVVLLESGRVKAAGPTAECLAMVDLPELTFPSRGRSPLYR